MSKSVDEINWDKLSQKKNKDIEDLSYEEQQLLKKYELQKIEEELYISEFPNKNIEPYKS